jgi:hypothetical protein
MPTEITFGNFLKFFLLEKIVPVVDNGSVEGAAKGAPFFGRTGKVIYPAMFVT